MVHTAAQGTSTAGAALAVVAARARIQTSCFILLVFGSGERRGGRERGRYGGGGPASDIRALRHLRVLMGAMPCPVPRIAPKRQQQPQRLVRLLPEARRLRGFAQEVGVRGAVLHAGISAVVEPHRKRFELALLERTL